MKIEAKNPLVWIVLLAVAIALAGLAPGVAAADDEGPPGLQRLMADQNGEREGFVPPGLLKKHELFSDWDEAGWAQKHISRARAMGLMEGDAEGTFRPGATISRIEAVVTAVRLLDRADDAEDEEHMTADLPLTDARAVHVQYPWAIGYVDVAIEEGLIDAGAAFNPNRPASRAWAARLLVLALELDVENGEDDLPFHDAEAIPEELKPYVAAAVRAELITGHPNGTFQPNRPIKRSEMAAILGRTGDLDDGEPELEPGLERLEGELLAVTRVEGDVADAVYLSVYLDSQVEVELVLDGDVSIFVNEEEAGVDDLEAGQTVLLDVDEEETVHHVFAFDPDEDEGTDPDRHEGTLTGLSLTESGFVLDLELESGDEISFILHEDVLVFVGDDQGTLADLSIGQSLLLFVDEEELAFHIEVFLEEDEGDEEDEDEEDEDEDDDDEDEGDTE